MNDVCEVLWQVWYLLRPSRAQRVGQEDPSSSLTSLGPSHTRAHHRELLRYGDIA